MKKIENINTQILNADNAEMKLSEVIAIPILIGQDNSTDDMRKNFKILDKLEAAKEKEEIILEADEYNRVKSKWQAFRWRFQHKDILACEDKLFGAADVNVDAKKVDAKNKNNGKIP